MTSFLDPGGESRRPIKERLGIEVVVEPGETGQFDVIVDDDKIASRGGNAVTRILFGAGFPDLEQVVAELQERTADT